MVPKKGDDGDVSTGKGTGEDSTRMAEMEGRVHRLEEQLAMALDELRQARTREISLQTWAREMVMHVGQIERGKSCSRGTMPDWPRNLFFTSFIRQQYPSSGISTTSIPRQCRYARYGPHDTAIFVWWRHVQQFIRFPTLLQYAIHGCWY